MKTILRTALISSLLALPLTVHAAEDGHGHSHDDHNHEMMEHKDSEAVMVKGIIHRVSRMNKKVNITHDPIPALDWPEMTMDLDVADDVDLKGLPVGEEIQFHIELGDDKVYRITKIMPMDGDDSE